MIAPKNLPPITQNQLRSNLQSGKSRKKNIKETFYKEVVM
jgi:hypothetical protein